MSKIVLFTQRVEIIESYNERRDCADQRIADFIKNCGYIPIPLPNKVECAKEIIEETSPSGIVLTGGNSLVKYGGNAPEKDDMDAELIKIAIEKNIPIYGFCRGMQSVLDYFGNDLVSVNGHIAVRHNVKGDINENENSYHGQGCMQIKNKDIQVLAIADDGVIEAINHKRYPILCTMWHPEREDPYRKEDIDRLKNLFN